MSHFVLQEFCWFSEKDALETDVFPSIVTTTAVKARHVTCGKTSLWITDINCIYLSFKQKITLSTDSERLRLAVTRQTNIQWVICFCGIITKAFVYLVQWGRKEEFNGPLIHWYSDRFVLCRTKWLQDLLLLPKLEKSTAAGQLSHLAHKPNLAENLSTWRI